MTVKSVPISEQNPPAFTFDGAAEKVNTVRYSRGGYGEKAV
jgi:hypothetical protein